MTPNATAAGSSALTTTASVPAGGKIWVWVGWAAATTLNTVADNSGSPLSWTIAATVANGNAKQALVWADAPAGLASGTVITATFSAASGSRYMQGAYSTAVKAGAAAAVAAPGTGGTTNWASGALTVPAGSILIGGCYSGSGTTTVTNTPTGGNTELHDQNIATDSALTSCYQMGSDTSIAAQGTWSANGSPNAALAVQFDPEGVPDIEPDYSEFPNPRLRTAA